MTINRAASIRARLLNLARKRDENFDLVLLRYANERFLYRLSISQFRAQFVLKGALLFDLWFNAPHRPTRDADLLGFGSDDPDTLRRTMAAICLIPGDDGIGFDPATIRVEEIREEALYGGLRTKLVATLDGARSTLQIDVGFGDAVTPRAEPTEYRTLLGDLPAPRLRAYPRETVIAEKLEAIVSLGMGNSRMKDYFDLRALAHEGAASPATVGEAIGATFRRRRTPLPKGVPVGLSDDFAEDASKIRQWSDFLSKNRLAGPELGQVIAELRDYLGPMLRRAS